MRDMFILSKIWVQDNMCVLIGTLLGRNILLSTGTDRKLAA
jgi:hypothetical protein